MVTCVNDAPLLMNEGYCFVQIPHLNQGKKKVVLDPIWFWILEVHCHLFTCIIHNHTVAIGWAKPA